MGGSAPPQYFFQKSFFFINTKFFYELTSYLVDRNEKDIKTRVFIIEKLHYYCIIHFRNNSHSMLCFDDSLDMTKIEKAIVMKRQCKDATSQTECA